MTLTAPTLEPNDTILPRADGVVTVSSKRGASGSTLDGLFQRGALKAVFPRNRGMTAVLINTAGGVTGGDRFRASVTAGSDTTMTVTSQAAERAYRALPGETGHMRNHLKVEPGARLNWLPQETIIFDGANLERRLRCDCAADATALIVEPIVFGRTAMGENQLNGRISDRIELYHDGALVHFDSWTLEGDLTAHLSRPATANGAAAMANVIWSGAQAEALLPMARDIIGTSGAASLKLRDVLVIRLLAKDGYTLRKTLLPLLDFLTQAQLPTCWRL